MQVPGNALLRDTPAIHQLKRGIEMNSRIQSLRLLFTGLLILASSLQSLGATTPTAQAAEPSPSPAFPTNTQIETFDDLAPAVAQALAGDGPRLEYRRDNLTEEYLDSISIIIDDSPAVYPLTLDPWLQQAKLLPFDGTADDWFGFSVSISGDTVVVGARYDDDNGGNSGSAYVFEKPGGGWSGALTQTAKLLPSDGATDDFFGRSVSINGHLKPNRRAAPQSHQPERSVSGCVRWKKNSRR